MSANLGDLTGRSVEIPQFFIFPPSNGGCENRECAAQFRRASDLAAALAWAEALSTRTISAVGGAMARRAGERPGRIQL